MNNNITGQLYIRFRNDKARQTYKEEKERQRQTPERNRRYKVLFSEFY